ncbi:hypothetical protein AB0J01_41445 [Streptomyces sp. NPDC050204]|uniref:hypothetical protein n=1 Tax=Streptomyces sp. NPDC050204 TaxID=3155514 RepID=UPI003437E985
MTSRQILDKPADPIVFGPEYDPRHDPNSAPSAGAMLRAVTDVVRRLSAQAQPTSHDEPQATPIVIVEEGALIFGRVGKGKTSAAAVMRQLELLAHRRGRTVDITDGKNLHAPKTTS